MAKMEIPKRLAVCAMAQEDFVADSFYMSHIYFNDKAAKWERQDYCLTCWEKFCSQVQEGYFWKGKILPKKEALSISDEKALKLFSNLSLSSLHAKHMYVLALYLQRIKQIAARPEIGKGIFEIHATGEIVSVQEAILTPHEGAILIEEIKILIG